MFGEFGPFHYCKFDSATKFLSKLPFDPALPRILIHLSFSPSPFLFIHQEYIEEDKMVR